MGFSEWTWDLFEHRKDVRTLYLKYHPDKKPHGDAEAFRFVRTAVNALNKHSKTWFDDVPTVERLRMIVDPTYESSVPQQRTTTCDANQASQLGRNYRPGSVNGTGNQPNIYSQTWFTEFLKPLMRDATTPTTTKRKPKSKAATTKPKKKRQKPTKQEQQPLPPIPQRTCTICDHVFTPSSRKETKTCSALCRRLATSFRQQEKKARRLSSCSA